MIIMVLKEKERLTRLYTVRSCCRAYNCRSFDSSFKKLEDVTVDFLIRRMNEKSFAKGVNREQIKSCEQLGLSLEKFLEIALEAMKKISDELGL